MDIWPFFDVLTRQEDQKKKKKVRKAANQLTRTQRSAEQSGARWGKAARGVIRCESVDLINFQKFGIGCNFSSVLTRPNESVASFRLAGTQRNTEGDKS